MDPLFNTYFIPSKSEAHLHLITPAGKTFVTGLASRYDETGYDPVKLARLPKEEYENMLSHINDVLYDRWPCLFCQLIGYCLCPCTLGLSFFCPGI